MGARFSAIRPWKLIGLWQFSFRHYQIIIVIVVVVVIIIIIYLFQQSI